MNHIEKIEAMKRLEIQRRRRKIKFWERFTTVFVLACITAIIVQYVLKSYGIELYKIENGILTIYKL